MMYKIIKKTLSLCLIFAMIIGMLFNNSINNSVVEAITANTVVWDGTAAASYAGGNGTKETPYIIETPMQLYKAVTEKSTLDDNKTPKYYKVKDGVKELNLSGTYNWTATQLTNPFKGNFDGNGVVIKGLYSTGAKVGLFQYLGLGAVVKNITFDDCKVNSSSAAGAILANTLTQRTATTEGTLYTGLNNQTYGSVLIHNVAVINSRISATSYAAGIVAYDLVPDSIQFNNCLFDGVTTTLTAGNKMGIYGTAVWNDNYEIHNSVSIGAYIAPNKTDTRYYNDYSNYYNDANVKMTIPTYIRNSYSIDVNGTNLDIAGCRTDLTASYDNIKNDLIKGLPLLDWASGWAVATVGGRSIPMPTVRTAADSLGIDNEGRAVLDYGTYLGSQFESIGANIDGAYIDGTYGYFYSFKGSGTQADPYIINNGLDLARAIGSGGKNINQNLYFKLANDIDLSGFLWLSAVGYSRLAHTNACYKYVEFEGVINGNGHTITGLYAAANTLETTDISSCNGVAALIPAINGGIIKNLHIRNSHIGSEEGIAGAFYGVCSSASVIEGCSYEGTSIIGLSNTSNKITFKNSYFITDNEYKYFGANGKEITNLNNIDYSAGVWYKGANSTTPRLLNHTQNGAYIDIDGDGIAEEYTVNDIISLKSHLMWTDGYENIYGDIDKNGVTDITDLAILQRYMVGDYNKIEDGFWRNTELGNVEIFYGENDNYDAARKIELYLESVYSNIDIKKYVNNSSMVYKHSNDGVKNPDGKLDIVVGFISGTDYATDSSIGANQYRIKYDNNNKVLWLQGANFTAVEQAVLDFIDNANVGIVNAEPVTTAVCSLSAIKQPVTVEGKTYYYAWGDEFDGVNTDNTGLNYDNWHSRAGHAERNSISDYPTYRYQEYAPIGTLNKIITVSDGKLTLNRGYRKGATYGGTTVNSDTAGYDGYVGLTNKEIGTTNSYVTTADKYFNSGLLSTVNSMLFKKGYVEIMASLPADGHAFPALWLYGGGISNSNLNSGWDSSLYSKIYSINNSWNKSDNITWSTSATKKYNVPSNFYELDIIELMQAYYRISGSQDRFVDYYSVDTTIHKWTWSNSGNASTQMSHKTYDFGTPYRSVYNSSYADELANIQKMRKYGFLWDTTSSGTTLKTFIYDVNGTTKTIDATLSGTKINDYLQIIIDNEFYSGDTSQEYSNMLKTVSGKNAKAKLEVDYVRVYQLDDKRDIVTVETENFNNGNHFGY